MSNTQKNSFSLTSKALLSALLLTVMLAFGAGEMWGQCIPCADPATQCSPLASPQSGSFLYTGGRDGFFVGNDCFYEYKFRIQTCKCPSEIYKIQIDEITLHGDCDNVDSKTIVTEAIRWCLLNFAHYFDMNQAWLRGWTVQISTPSCWSRNPITKKMLPCGTEECCTEYHVRCLDNGPNLIDITRLTNNSSNCSEGCKNLCDAQELPIGNLYETGMGQGGYIICENVDPCPNVYWSTLPKFHNTWLSSANDGRWFPTVDNIFYNGQVLGTSYCSYKQCNGQNLVKLDKIYIADSRLTKEYAITKAIYNIIKSANGYFDKQITNDQEFCDFKIVMPSCWRLLGNWLLPCNSNDCCSGNYRVTLPDPNITGIPYPIMNNYKYKKVIIASGFINSGTLCTSSCENYCNYLENPSQLDPSYSTWLDPGYLQKESVIEQKLLTVDCIFNCVQNGNKIELQITGNDNGASMLKIFNITGELVFETSFEKKAENQTIEFEHNLTSGIYLWQVIMNQTSNCSGKLIINK